MNFSIEEVISSILKTPRKEIILQMIKKPISNKLTKATRPLVQWSLEGLLVREVKDSNIAFHKKSQYVTVFIGHLPRLGYRNPIIATKKIIINWQRCSEIKFDMVVYASTPSLFFFSFFFFFFLFFFSFFLFELFFFFFLKPEKKMRVIFWYFFSFFFFFKI